MAGYRCLEKREPVYLNEAEAEMIKTALYCTINDCDDPEKDMVCEIVVEMNKCITENRKRDRRADDEPLPIQ